MVPPHYSHSITFCLTMLMQWGCHDSRTWREEDKDVMIQFVWKRKSGNAMAISFQMPRSCYVNTASTKYICPVLFKGVHLKNIVRSSCRLENEPKVWLSVSPRSASAQKWASSFEFSQLPSLTFIVAGVEVWTCTCRCISLRERLCM